MKVCSYCGKEYPDEATVCELDENPLIGAQAKPVIVESEKTLITKKTQPITITRALSVFGFSILSGFCGLGATWLVVACYAGYVIRDHEPLNFVVKFFPVMIVAGIVSFLVGLVISARVASVDDKIKKKIERKYVGSGGRLYVYFGFSMFIIVLLVSFLGRRFEMFETKIGTTASVYVELGILLIIVTLSLILYDRIPSKFIIPIGIVGWLLILVMGLAFAVRF